MKEHLQAHRDILFPGADKFFVIDPKGMRIDADRWEKAITNYWENKK